MTTIQTQRSLTDRMKGAAMLDVSTYEEVEADQTATPQAAIVIGIVAVASAIGMAGEGSQGIIGGIIGAFIGWLIWAGVTYLVGVKVMGGTATWGELLRTLGFAQSPGVLYVLGIIPLLGVLVRFGVAVWVIIAGVIAIRQALDVSTGKAVLTAVLSFLAIMIVMSVLAMIGIGASLV
jgi:hypothetical protein